MEYLAIWMIVALFICLVAGYPVAFTLGGIVIIFGYFGLGLDFFNLLPLRIWGVMTNFILLAVPLFVFMGVLLERSGMAEDLLETMALLFCKVRGGLAIAVIVVGALLAASTGIVEATVVTMELLALPTMLRRNYHPELATGVISSSGTLGQIIPPSIILALLVDIMSISVGDLFIAAVLPGLTLVGKYITWVLFIVFIKPHIAPAVPLEERAQIFNMELTVRILKALVPPTLLMVAVLGSIFFGVASPTESAAMGGTGALLLTILNGKLNFEMMQEAVQITTKLTCMIFIILIGAITFGLVFRGLDVDVLVREFMVSAPIGANGALFMVMAMLFILGFFLYFIEITFIVIPIVAPVIVGMGFDPIWFAILVAMNLQTSFLTPPFGFALFYLKGVAPPSITTKHLYKGVIPFIIIRMIALSLLVILPKLATWLPELTRQLMFG